MEMQERINNYWSKRADEFSACRLQDLAGEQGEIWTRIIKDNLPDKPGIRALDVGTGAGFFAFLLKEMGVSSVAGIDYARAMVDNARANARTLGMQDIHFETMDAQNLRFDDHSFDFIISRNVTWTLPDPARAYDEWCRVLAPGGVLLNVDANYGKSFENMDPNEQADRMKKYYAHASYKHPALSPEMILERNDIAKSLYICDIVRPQWDVDILIKNGIRRICLDTDMGTRIYSRMKTQPRSQQPQGENDKKLTALFMVCAQKPETGELN